MRIKRFGAIFAGTAAAFLTVGIAMLVGIGAHTLVSERQPITIESPCVVDEPIQVAPRVRMKSLRDWIITKFRVLGLA